MQPKTTRPRPSSLDYRPASYWKNDDPLAAILRNVKGTKRRELIRNAWNNDTLEDFDDALLGDTLDDDLRTALGRIHPSLMGGEYLPGLLPTEIPIACVSLASTTGDVISIRARKEPGDKRIHYRIVDEYQGMFRFHYSPKTSEFPFTFGEMIRFIDHAGDDCGTGLGTAYNDFNYEDNPNAEQLRGFTSISSGVYPALYDHYVKVQNEWADERLELERESQLDEA